MLRLEETEVEQQCMTHIILSLEMTNSDFSHIPEPPRVIQQASIPSSGQK
jgi:hypothetical protein